MPTNFERLIITYFCIPLTIKSIIVKPCFCDNLSFLAQGGLSVAGGCRCLTKDGNTSIEKKGYIPYPLQA